MCNSQILNSGAHTSCQIFHAAHNQTAACILRVLTLLRNAIKLWNFAEAGSSTSENSLKVLPTNYVSTWYVIYK